MEIRGQRRDIPHLSGARLSFRAGSEDTAELAEATESQSKVTSG